MKKLIALMLALTLLLCGCGAQPEEPTNAPATETQTATGEAQAPTQQTEATEEPTEEATTEPAEPVYTNPLNGEILEEPYTGRIFAASISNVREAIPHVGIQDAEIVMEMFVNDSIVRCLALYTDITSVDVVGPIRSLRLMFSDLSAHYDLVPCFAGGSDYVINDFQKQNLDGVHVDRWECMQYGASFRDKNRNTIPGLTYENTLMLDTDVLVDYAESKGVELTRDERDYGLLFTEDGIPQDGEDAKEINIRFQYRNTIKDTTMKYDEELGKYVFWQYGKMMTDGTTQEPETFQNVVIMDAPMTLQYAEGASYYKADFLQGGSGYYACGGKIIPLTWTCEGEDQPFRFFDQDGEPLAFNVGNSYIAIVPVDSPVSYE